MQSTRAFSESTLHLPSGERVPAKQAGEGGLSLPLPSGERAGERGSASSPSPSLLNSLFTALQNPINTIPDIAAELGLSIPDVAALLATPEAQAHFVAIEQISAARCRLELTEARPAAIAALRDLTYDNRTPETTRKAATKLLTLSASRGGGILPPSPRPDEPKAQARVFLPLPSGERAGERGRLSPPPLPVGEVSAKQTEGANSSSLSRAPRERAGVRAPDLLPLPMAERVPAKQASEAVLRTGWHDYHPLPSHSRPGRARIPMPNAWRSSRWGGVGGLWGSCVWFMSAGHRFGL